MYLPRIFALAATLAACGGGSSKVDNDPFDTYQACFDEHTMTESFPAQVAIKICCLDHPIGSADMNVVCGETSAACVTYVGANLNPAPAASDIQMACDGYIHDRGQ